MHEYTRWSVYVASDDVRNMIVLAVARLGHPAG